GRGRGRRRRGGILVAIVVVVVRQQEGTQTNQRTTANPPPDRNAWSSVLRGLDACSSGGRHWACTRSTLSTLSHRRQRSHNECGAHNKRYDCFFHDLKILDLSERVNSIACGNATV